MTDISYSDLFENAVSKFKNNPAVIHYTNDCFSLYTYEFLNELSKDIINFISNEIKTKEVIGILLSHNPLIIPIIKTIHKIGCTFIFLHPDESNDINENILNDLEINFVFALNGRDTLCNNYISVSLNHLIIKLKQNLFLWKRIKSNCLIKTKQRVLNEISYYIQTSGTTDIAKYVAVPHVCIFPNICDFETLFNIQPCDIIYFSTPLTFDPSVVELYLAAKSGSALMIAPLNADILFLKEYKITIWQTTPSKFLSIGLDEIKRLVLSEFSSLKILALGGEPLCFDLEKLSHPNNNTEIYNLYGITEVSCWASVNKIVKKEKNEYLCLGEPLQDTLLSVFNENKEKVDEGKGFIFIGSSARVCFVEHETIQNKNNICDNFANVSHSDSKVIWRNTGDLGIKVNNKIYFNGRSDKSIKRFGRMINLLNIEITAMKFNGIKQCICVWNHSFHTLHLFYTCNSVNRCDFLLFLKKTLDIYCLPDNIIECESLPVNNHGKLSINDTMTGHMNIENSKTAFNIGTVLMKLLNEYLPNKHYNIEKRSFLDIGGSSISAIQLVNQFQNISQTSIPNMYSCLLDPNFPLRTLFTMIETAYKDVVYEDKYLEGNFITLQSKNNVTIEINPKKRTISKNLHNFNEEKLCEKENSKCKVIKQNMSIEILWKYDMKKCVDANPIIHTTKENQTYMLVGSHSGEFIIIDLNRENPIFSINLSSRIEAPAICVTHKLKTLAVVGCYDGSLWCISVSDTKVLWKTVLKSMIKSQACCIDNCVYAATYNSDVNKIEIESGNCLSSIAVGIKGISADIISSGKYIFLATLDGICVKIDCSFDLPVIMWEYKVESPVFAKPSFFKKESQVLFNEVNGKIHCVDVSSGDVIWIFGNMLGLLFSSCITMPFNSDTNIFIFGCHDKHTYKASISNEYPIVDWKVKNISEVYATPHIKKSKTVVSVSTKGQLQFIDISSGQIAYEYALPGEVFSSPVINEDRAYVGCRDNNLYCLKITEL